MLQTIPQPPEPKPMWEQYQTPATIAADVLYQSYGNGDINAKHVIDLGCGTGMFAIGAALLGAHLVTAVDIDQQSIAIAQSQAQKLQVAIDFLTQPIDQVNVVGDTVIMNPPFGAQKSNLQADRRFLEKAMAISSVIYSLHLAKTFPFLQKMIHANHGIITHMKTYDFPLPHQFMFHQKTTSNIDVVLLRITTAK